MNILHLDSDELDIECQIRDIRGSITNRLSQLETALTAEKTELGKEPTQLHYMGARYPKRELQLCSTKLCNIQDLAEQLVKEGENMNIDKLSEFTSVVSHIQGRLRRIQMAKTCQTEVTAGKLLESCDKLLKCFKDLLEKHISIPDVDKSIKELIILENVGVDEIEYEREGKGVVDTNRLSDDVATTPIYKDEERNLLHLDEPCTSHSVPLSNGQPDQIDAIVNAVMERLSLSTGASLNGGECKVTQSAVKPDLHSSTMITQERVKQVPKFNPTVPPPNYHRTANVNESVHIRDNRIDVNTPVSYETQPTKRDRSKKYISGILGSVEI